MQRDIVIKASKLILSKLIPAVFLSLINIIFSRELETSEYGSYQAVWTYLNICIVFTVFGLPKYILGFGKVLAANHLKKAILISLIISLLIFIPLLFYLIHKEHFDYQSSVFFLIVLMSQSFYFIQEAYATSVYEGNKLIMPNLIYAVSLFLVHMYLLYDGVDFNLSMCILGVALVSISRNLIMWRVTGKGLRKGQNTATDELPKPSLIFYLGLNDSLQILTKWLDKLILLFLLTSADYAIYFNGTFELPLIGMLILAFQSIITIQGAKDDVSEMELVSLFRNSAFFMSGVLFPLFALLFWYSKPIVDFLFSSKYEGSSVFFALSTLYLPVRVCSYTILLQLKNKGDLILKGSIMDFVLSVVLMFVLYPLFNLNGLVLALVIATYVQATYYLLKIVSVYNVSINQLVPLKALLLRLSITVVIVGGGKYLLNDLSPLYNLCIGILMSATLFFLYIKQSIGLNVKNIFSKVS